MRYYCLGIAWLALIAAIVWGVFYPYHWKSKWRSSRGYIFVVCLLVSVFFLVLGFLIGKKCLDGWEKTIETISNVMQFFSLDMQYEELAKCAACVYPETVGTWAFLSLSTILTALAPLAGACFIGELLCSFIPRWRLFISWKRTKYVFSELNERSITLAEDIARLSWERRFFHQNKYDFEKENIDPGEARQLKSACIIFTDAYSDERAETSSELLLRAKRIGAICLKDDILERTVYFSHFILRFFSFLFGKICKFFSFLFKKPFKGGEGNKVVYFLMDTKEEDNLTSAISLLSDRRSLWKKTITMEDEERAAYKKNCVFFRGMRWLTQKTLRTDRMEMYVFTQNESAASLIEHTFLRRCEKIEVEGKIQIAKCDRNIIVKTINEYRNLIYNQILTDHDCLAAQAVEETGVGSNPLYLQKLFAGDKEDISFHFLVLGAGRLAREFIKAALWCGQIADTPMHTYPLKISVLAENAEDLKNELIFEMPYLYDGNRLKPEFCESALFENCKFGDEAFKENLSTLLEKNGSSPDLILVAFGDDDMNLLAGQWMGDRIADGTIARPCRIYFAIEDTALCKALQSESEHGAASSKERILCPFASLSETFRFSNIRMDKLECRALNAERVHETRNMFKNDRVGFLSHYNRDSSMATALHLTYKLFSEKLLVWDEESDRIQIDKKSGGKKS